MPNQRKKLKKPGYVPSLAAGQPVQHCRVVDRDDPPPEALRHTEIAELRGARYDNAVAVIKRSGLHDSLHAAGKISYPAWKWVERYCRAVEIVEGGADGKSDQERVDSGRPESFYPRQVREATFLRISEQRMHGFDRQLVRAACVQCWILADVARVVLLISRGAAEDAEAYRARVKSRVWRAVVAAIEAGCGEKKPVVA